MSPRITRYEFPPWKIKAIKNKTKEVLFGPFECPECHEDKLKVKIDTNLEEVYAICNCGLKHEFKYIKSYQSVDYYNQLLDESR